MTDTNDMRREFATWLPLSYETECDEIAWQAWQTATERATASQWKPIETAPMHQVLLVSLGGCGITLGLRIGNSEWSWVKLDDEPADATVSHWMRLPPPPAIRQGFTIGETL